jgi:hypothetical protein
MHSRSRSMTRPYLRALAAVAGAAVLALVLPFVLPALAGGAVTNCANELKSGHIW